jgi:hypothetical protein
VVLVERRADGVMNIGSTGLWTETGLAYLVWREGRPFFVAKGSERPADPGQIADLRRFSDDLVGSLEP